MSADNIIEIEHLSKSFGQIKAVDDLSFRVKRGELFAFLGVNGVGKSTTISMICGLLKKDAGSIRVCGSEVEKTGGDTSKKLGIVFQNSVLDAPLTVLQNLRCRAALYGITGKAFSERIDGLCGLLGLSDILNRPVGKLRVGSAEEPMSQERFYTVPRYSFSTNQPPDSTPKHEKSCGTPSAP